MKVYVLFRRCFLVIGIAAYLAGAVAASAATRTNYWVGGATGDGIFSDPQMWQDTSYVPDTPNDWTRYTTGTATVTFTNDADGYSAQVYNSGTAVVWNLGGHTYTLTSTSETLSPVADGTSLVVGHGSDGSHLTVTNGNLVSHGFLIGYTRAGSLTLAGPGTTWTNTAGSSSAGTVGGRVQESVLRIEHGAQAHFQHRFRLAWGDATRGTVEIVGQGSKLVSTTTVDLGNFGHGRARVADGGEWVIQGGLEIGRGTLGTHDASGTLEIDRGRVTAQSVRFDMGTVTNTFKVTLHSGATDALLVADRDITLSAVTVLDLVLEDAFQATPFEDVFTLVKANNSGGGYGLHGEFIDAGGSIITHGSVLKASTFFEEFEFLAEYTADNRFTLTVIPEPGALGLLGGALAVLLAARMNRRQPNA